MIEEIRLPEISENVESGDVVKVLVSVGDTVEVDQPLVELETEKAVFEVPSTVAGTVTEIMVSAGEVINVGAVIARIETDAGAATTASAPEQEEAPPAAPEPQVEKQPAPVAAEPTASAIKKAVVAVVDQDAKPRAVAPPASPSVRRLARELGIDINQVSGSGASGRISSQDVHAHAKRIITATASGAVPRAGRPLPDFSRWGEVEREAMSKVRKITAQRMADAWNTVPRVTHYDEADITDLEAARKAYGRKAEAAGGKLTMTAILLKVCASALKAFPQLNASVDAERSEVVYKKYYNIGIAVDTDRGLLVPVVRNVDQKNIIELSVELTDISEKARTKKIKPDQLEGGNFTISNLGGIGGTGFSPIVYTPEVAILGVSRASMQPVYQPGNGEFVARLVLPLSLSYDHRLIDGATAARFLRWVCEALERPILLALEG